MLKNWNTDKNDVQLQAIATADPSGRFKRALANMKTHTGQRFPISKEMFNKIKDL